MSDGTEAQRTLGPNSTFALRLTLVGLTAGTVYLCWSLWPALVLASWTAALIAAVGTWGAVLGPLVVRLWMEALVLQREAESALAPTCCERTQIGTHAGRPPAR